jgi:multimeric flavodoxin WrbA/putative sterol carrier protein
MKILVLRSNPRKDGFSQYLIDIFVEGAKGNADITDIDLTTKKLNPCKGCFKCWTQTPGNCIQQDDMKELLQLFMSTDIVVFATPLYAFAVSSYCKMFQERTLPLLSGGIVKNANGSDTNVLRFPDKMPKKLAAIIVGGLKSNAHSKGIIASLKSYAEGFGIEFAGVLNRPESYILKFTDTKPKTIKCIESAFFEAGQALAIQGSLSEEVQKKASLPLAPDLEYFQRYSNIYWDYARLVQKRGSDLKEACLLTSRDITILMYEMARSIDSTTTKEIKASFQFEFSDKGTIYSIVINNGESTLIEESLSNPDLIIRCSSEIWVGIVRREKDPLKALVGGEITLAGNKDLFRKLHRYFPPPST